MTDRIVRLEIENTKRLIAVSITPDGNTVVIGGQNGAGKSSVLDAIEMALGGKGHVCKQPLHQGADEGYIIVETTQYVVRRRFKANGSTDIEVTTKEGHIVKSPQQLMDSWIGDLSFDPVAFVRLPAKDQRSMLMRLLKLDFTALDADYTNVEDERRLIGRERDQFMAEGRAIPQDPTVPADEVSVKELMEQLQEAQQKNAENAALRANVDRLNDAYDVTYQEVERLKGLLAEAEKTNEDTRSRLENAQKLTKGMEDVDTSGISQQIADADSTNERVRKQKQRKELGVKYRTADESYKAKTARLEEIKATKDEMISAAKFPVDGVTFGSDGILVNGIPFDQASSAEQLRIAVAMGLSTNPELPIILIRDGSLLDDNSLASVAQMAAEHEASVWIERVSDGAEVSIVIEDGQIAPFVFCKDCGADCDEAHQKAHRQERDGEFGCFYSARWKEDRTKQ